MGHGLLTRERIEMPARTYLESAGEVFAIFGEPEQDSGNVSYGVRTGDERFFVKTAGDPRLATPTLGHADRCDLLRNAARLYRSCPHPVLTTLRYVIESEAGPLLVYDWEEGDLLGQEWRQPGSHLARFRRLPPECICRVLDRIFDVHHALAGEGWIAVDFYLGSLLYDFAADRIRVIDVDLYRRGPFTNTMGRMFGSASLMAPEEFARGARIDQDTNVFSLARAAFLLLGDGSLERHAFRGGDALFEVVRRACREDRARRFGTVDAFYDAWRVARAEGEGSPTDAR